VAVAFLDAYRATGNKALLDAALGMIRFAEDSFATGSGLFCVGTRMPAETKSWLWTVEEVKQLLQPDDATWWIDAMGMRGLGNIAPEADPNRFHFRNNSLGWVLAPDIVAQKSGLSPEEFEARHARIAQTLLDARAKRIGTIVTPQTAHLPSTLRMVSAFAHAYAVTGDDAYRKKAVDTLNRVRETYWNKASFRLFEMETPAVIGEGRAFHYALAMLAAGDVYAITLDEAWLQWCEDMATISAERFSGIGFLRESSEASSLMDLPITDSAMLFDESTAGLVSMAEVRLSAGKRPMLKSFSDLAVPLPVSAVDQPILHTDILSSTLARSRAITVLIGRGMSEATRDVLTRLPPRLVQRRMALPEDAVEEGSVRILGLAAEPLDVAAGMALPLSLTMSQP
jgi:uncharacterized protein YyaL (SSP411 family)